MLTIFTPTYNRAYTLPRLYDSLLRQTQKDFEWLLIDDASTDETQELGEKWAHETTAFPVRYVKQPHGGKHRAWNRALDLAEGDGFCCLDSDDYLTDDFVEKMTRWFDEIKDLPTYNGICALRGYDEEHPIGGYLTLEGDYIDCPHLDSDLEAHGLLYDKATCYKTEVLKKYPFPTYEGEYFCAESVILVPMGLDGYITRWYNEILMICNYLPDGLTHQGGDLHVRNPRATMDYLDLQEKEQWHVERVPVARRWLVWEYLLAYGKEKAEQTFRNHLPVELDRAIVLSGGAREHITSQLAAQHSSHVAVYGLGGAGKMFLSLAKPLPIRIVCGIDRKGEAAAGDVPFPVYKPEEQLPPVDAVIVCLREGAAEVMAELSKTHRVFSMAELCGDEVWQQLWE